MPMSPDEGTFEDDRPGYRFGIVLLLVFVTFVFMACGFTGAWTRPVTVALQGLTLLAALSASRVSRRFWRFALIIVAIACLSALGGMFISGEEARPSFLIVDMMLVVSAPIAIGMSLARRRVVDIRTVLGALCIYVLLGMAFAFACAAVAELLSGPFFAQTSNPTTADFLYYSFITFTTTGFGDLTPVEGLGRAMASFEALTGQLYLVTIIAVLVSRMAMAPRPTRERAKRSTP
jgi:hypothetical protein